MDKKEQQKMLEAQIGVTKKQKNKNRGTGFYSQFCNFRRDIQSWTEILGIKVRVNN